MFEYCFSVKVKKKQKKMQEKKSKRRSFKMTEKVSISSMFYVRIFLYESCFLAAFF